MSCVIPAPSLLFSRPLEPVRPRRCESTYYYTTLSNASTLYFRIQSSNLLFYVRFIILPRGKKGKDYSLYFIHKKQTQRRKITYSRSHRKHSNPLYPWEVSSKTPKGCFKPWVVPHPVYTMIFAIWTYFVLLHFTLLCFTNIMYFTK